MKQNLTIKTLLSKAAPILDFIGFACYSIAGAMPTFLWVMIAVFFYSSISGRFIDVSEWSFIALLAFVGQFLLL